MEKLKDRGVFPRSGLSVLDIGSSNLYSANKEGVISYVRSYSASDAGSELEAFAERLSEGSAYHPIHGGVNKAFAGELIERCGMRYLSFDIARGYKTEIFDLNREKLPDRYRGSFDVVLNVGTTEHVLNQYNSFTVIHEAARPGGYIVHQLPIAGHTDHGLYVYTTRMFFELADCNRYEIIDAWYDFGGEDDLYLSAQAFASRYPALSQMSKGGKFVIPNVGITIIYRKTHRAPFAGALEMSTSVGAIPLRVRLAYSSSLLGKLNTIAMPTVIKLKTALRNSRFMQSHPRVLEFLRRVSRRRPGPPA